VIQNTGVMMQHGTIRERQRDRSGPDQQRRDVISPGGNSASALSMRRAIRMVNGGQHFVSEWIPTKRRQAGTLDQYGQAVDNAVYDIVKD